MKRLRVLLAAFALCLAAAVALGQDTTSFTNMVKSVPQVGVTDGTELFPIIKGSATNRITLAQLVGKSVPVQTAAPACPGGAPFWVNTASSPAKLEICDGTAWLAWGAIDTISHAFIPPLGGGLGALTASPTVDLCQRPEAAVEISGTGPISDFGTACPIGLLKVVSFNNSLTLVYNASSMVLPGLTNLTVVSGDTGIVQRTATGWRMIVFQPASAASTSLQANNNLADLQNPASARTNLGLGTAATKAASSADPTVASVSGTLTAGHLAVFADTNGTLQDGGAIGGGGALVAANNLSDLANASTARSNLGLGASATHPLADFAQTGLNLSDLTNVPTARTNLGLGSAAVDAHTSATGKVASASGSFTAGHCLTALDTSGTIQDGGSCSGLSAIANLNFLANTSGGSAVPVATTASTFLDAALGSSRGSILERGASGWTAVAPSATSGQVWTSNGTGVDSSYKTLPPFTPAVTTKTGAYAVLTSDCGKTLVLNSASPATFSLPSDASAGNGCLITFVNRGAGILTLAAAGSDTIAEGGSTSLTTLDLDQGDAGTLTADGLSGGIWFGLFGSAGAGGDINIASVGGTAVALGQTTAANSIPVVLPSDTSITISGGSLSATGTVGTTAADGTNVALGAKADAANAATDTTSVSLISLAKEISAIGQSHNATVAAGTAPANAVVVAGQYNSTLPTPSTGQTNGLQLDPSGRVRAVANPSVFNIVSGSATQTSTTSTQLIAAVASKSIYVTSFNCANSGVTNSTVTFQDGSGGTALNVTANAAGSGSNLAAGGVPLFKTTAGNGLYFAPSNGSTTQYCNASGFTQ